MPLKILKILFPMAVIAPLLIACIDTQKPDQPIGTGECAAEGFSHLVGKDKSLLDSISLPDPHRIILPNSAVTMDYNEMRINFVIAETGLIESIKCF
jgi:hypothetical protein